MNGKIIAACGNDCAVCPRYVAHPYEKTIVRIIQESCPNNLRTLSGCYRNPVRITQESCPDVIGMLSECCKNHQKNTPNYN